MNWYPRVLIKTNRINIFARLGIIKENIACHIIKTILTISTIVSNSFLLFLYRFLISFNLFILYHMTLKHLG